MKQKSKKIKIGLKLVNQIQNIRTKNNKNWMDLLRLSLKLDFNSTSKILKEICKDDKKISKLAQKIYELNKLNENKIFFIAEISANHCGNFNLAKLIQCAHLNGADAVKLQTYTADTMTANSNKEYFKIKEGLWKG